MLNQPLKKKTIVIVSLVLLSALFTTPAAAKEMQVIRKHEEKISLSCRIRASPGGGNQIRLNRSRPTEERSGDGDYFSDTDTVLTRETDKFRLHYTESPGSDNSVAGSDGDPGTIPWFVSVKGDSLEKAYGIIAGQGFTPPSGGRIDIYLLHLPGTLGYTVFDGTSSPNVYIVMDNDYAGISQANQDPDGDLMGLIRVTCAHELFHTFQFQYSLNVSANSWWMETSSVWMEDRIYPLVNDYRNYIGLKYDDNNRNGKWNSGEPYYLVDGTYAGNRGRYEGWFDTPHLSLNDTSGLHAYGNVIWAKFLSESYGDTIILDIWEMTGRGKTALAATDEVLSTYGTSLDRAFSMFQTRNFFLDYEAGRYYPQIRIDSTYTTYSQTLTGNLNPLSSRFYSFKPAGASGTLSLTFEDMNTGNIAAKLYLSRSGSSRNPARNPADFRVQDIDLSEDTVLMEISGFGSDATYDEATVAVINTDMDSRGGFFYITASAPSKVVATSSSTVVAGSCFISASGGFLPLKSILLFLICSVLLGHTIRSQKCRKTRTI